MRKNGRYYRFYVNGRDFDKKADALKYLSNSLIEQMYLTHCKKTFEVTISEFSIEFAHHQGWI